VEGLWRWSGSREQCRLDEFVGECKRTLETAELYAPRAAVALRLVSSGEMAAELGSCNVEARLFRTPKWFLEMEKLLQQVGLSREMERPF